MTLKFIVILRMLSTYGTSYNAYLTFIFLSDTKSTFLQGLGFLSQVSSVLPYFKSTKDIFRNTATALPHGHILKIQNMMQ